MSILKLKYEINGHALMHKCRNHKVSTEMTWCNTASTSSQVIHIRFLHAQKLESCVTTTSDLSQKSYLVTMDP